MCVSKVYFSYMFYVCDKRRKKNKMGEEVLKKIGDMDGTGSINDSS